MDADQAEKDLQKFWQDAGFDPGHLDADEAEKDFEEFLRDAGVDPKLE